MATYGDMKTRVAEEINRADLTTNIERAILSAVAYYAGFRFAGNEKRGTITTIAGTRLYNTSTASPGTLPTDVVEIDSIVCTVSGRDYLLEETSYEHLDDIDPGTSLTTGDPRMWAWYAGGLRIYPTPNAARVLTISYQYVLTALSGSSDSNFWTNDAEALVRSRAKKLLAVDVLNDDELARRMEVMEQQELSAMRKRTNKLITSGRIKATPF